MLAKRFGWCLAILLSLCLGRVAYAHPMGNFSVNHYAKISVQSDRVRIDYLIDLAEIPAYQELQQGNITATANDPAVTRFIAVRGVELGRGLRLFVDGRAVALRMVSSGVIFPAGAGGLPTMKMGFVYEAAYPEKTDRVHVSVRYVDDNYPGHTGWKEVIALASAGSLLKSSVPSKDRSNELSNYPTDLLNSPPLDLEASVEAQLPAAMTQPIPSEAHTVSPARQSVRVEATSGADNAVKVKHADASVRSTNRSANQAAKAVGPVVASSRGMHLEANQQRTPRNRFTELITEQHLSLWFLFTAAIIAMGLGALHALEPGHGKTIVAAYLVGSKGTARHAILLGMIVTASHTAGVFALGAVTLYASRYIVPEQLYPWLGVLSGIVIAGLGCYMFLRRVTGTATDHSHEPGSGHGHLFGMSTEQRTDGVENAGKRVSMGQLFTLGITGGIIPCPAALIVLLSAFALHRVGLGFFLIVAFSLGLAAVLIGFGMLMVYARRFMTRLQMDGPLTTRWLPIASSAFITVLGVGLAIQAFATTHLSLSLDLHLLTKEKLGPLLFVTGLGLILGMRHSTDADHVVAISTIVTRQRSIRGAAMIGSVWGLGHTITIFIVGSLIILFGVEIPPRVGLSMEFSVAIMLILLGVLNLTGVMQKITSRFTPASFARLNGTDVAEGNDTKARLGYFENSAGRLGAYQFFRPLVIGLVHGLAGSAAVALLVLSTIHDPYWATGYLIIFGLGTMIGMMLMTTAMAVPLTFAGERFSQLSRYLGLASGMVSLCFGSFLVYQLGIVGGLFTSHPQWTPQ